MLAIISPVLCCICLLPLLRPAAQASAPQKQGVHSSRKRARFLPLPKEEGVFHFLIFGDRTGGPAEGIKVLEKAVLASNLLGPDIVMTVGDLIQGYTSKQQQWLLEMKEFKAVMDGLDMPWYPVAGNHDIYWGRGRAPFSAHEKNYEQHFGPLWYWFPHKNAAFIVLFTDEGDPKTGKRGFRSPKQQQMSPLQLDWLGKTLEETKDKDHVFLFMHHPRWQSQRYRFNNWSKVHELLEKAGNVSAVFAGHIHHMSYGGKRDGIEYYSLSTTGGSHGPQELRGGGLLHHMNLVTVRKSGITVAALPVSSVIDPKAFTRQHLADFNLLRQSRPVARTKALLLHADGSAASLYRFLVKNPATQPILVTIEGTSRDGSWIFRPDHIHKRIAPLASQVFEIRCLRGKKGFGTDMAYPALGYELSYLGSKLRAELPAKEFFLPLLPAQQPKALPEGTANAYLRLSSRSASLMLAQEILTIPTAKFSVEAWIRVRDLTARKAVLGNHDNAGFQLGINKGKPYFTAQVMGKALSIKSKKTKLVAGKWQHLAAVRDEAEIRLYLDGRLLAKLAAVGPSRRTVQPLFIGADASRRGRPELAFGGDIDEVRISTSVRYRGDSFEPSRRYQADDDSILLLHLDRDFGPFMIDASKSRAHPLRLGRSRITR